MFCTEMTGVAMRFRFSANFLVCGCLGSHKLFYDETRFIIMRMNRSGR